METLKKFNRESYKP